MNFAKTLFEVLVIISFFTFVILCFGMLCSEIAQTYKEFTDLKKEHKTNETNLSRFENEEVVCYYGDKKGVWCHWKSENK
jgi:hypothetical protein